MDHTTLTAEISEQLTLYALGALDAAEDRAWETHLAAGCAVCRRELAEIQSAAATLASSAPPVSPPSHLKGRLLERVQTAASDWMDPDGHRRRPGFSSLDWEPSGQPGVSFHWLRRDPTTRTASMLVKFQPGATYPAHRHYGGEDCLVIQGRICDRRGEYRAGDYVYYEPGSVHYDLEALEGDETILFVVAHHGVEILRDSHVDH